MNDSSQKLMSHKRGEASTVDVKMPHGGLRHGIPLSWLQSTFNIQTSKDDEFVILKMLPDIFDTIYNDEKLTEDSVWGVLNAATTYDNQLMEQQCYHWLNQHQETSLENLYHRFTSFCMLQINIDVLKKIIKDTNITRIMNTEATSIAQFGQALNNIAERVSKLKRGRLFGVILTKLLQESHKYFNQQTHQLVDLFFNIFNTYAQKNQVWIALIP